MSRVSCLGVAVSRRGGQHHEDLREQLLHRNVQRFRGGLVFKDHRLCESLNPRLESNKEEEETGGNSQVMRKGGTYPCRVRSALREKNKMVLVGRSPDKRG